MPRSGIFAFVVVLATLLRLIWVLVVPTKPVGDFALYLESAAYLLERGALDPEFIYMPGYVLLLAGVRAVGGGLLAAKLIGVAAGALATAAAFGIADRLFGRRAAITAGLMSALWPAGIAVASVTGTDMPAGALLLAAVWALVRWGADRPWRAAIVFGLILGLAAYVRAVAVPLAFVAFFYWIASGASQRVALARTAVGAAIAFLVLLPWGVRNHARYGELFITDSHGGHTALVGSNPNSEGTYSRSLNLMFQRVTGHRLFHEPHRASDRAAYGLARSWAAFEPAYAAGLVVAKADRLLTNERPLLYWPIYRQGVLREPQRSWFDRRRALLDGVADGFWYLLVGAALFGATLTAIGRPGAGAPGPAARRWAAPSLLLFPLALIALYAVFFSEVRYHLAIAVFLFPFAGAALDGLLGAATPGARRAWARRAALAMIPVAILFGGWPALVSAGARLRDRHRWAVTVCRVAGHAPAADRVCAWRRSDAPAGRSPVRGVWDGVGLRLSAVAAVAAETRVALPPGRYAVRARLDRTGAARDDAATPVALDVGGHPAWSGSVFDAAVDVDLAVDHPGGELTLRLRAGAGAPATIWLGGLSIEPRP